MIEIRKKKQYLFSSINSQILNDDDNDNNNIKIMDIFDEKLNDNIVSKEMIQI